MNISKIFNMGIKPSLYANGSAFMWTDPYISQQLLATHLNTEIDLASRKMSSIDLTIDWIISQLPNRSLKILDLGCGPGLYAEKLAALGHSVTGVDISSTSIQHAKVSATQKGLDINYVESDYLNFDFEPCSYDLVMIIYTDMGVLTPIQRNSLLQQISASLKAGATLIFDVLNDTHMEQRKTPPSWEVSNQGFWSDKPYVLLSNSFDYPDEKVILYQHFVIDHDEEIKSYRFWTHFFSANDIRDMLAPFSFEMI